jgi:protein arginine kinase activator
MLCDKCKNNNATRKCIANINGYKEELFLCNDCYEKLYNKIFDVETNFFTNIFNDAFNGVNIVRDKVCKVCGTKLSEFNKTGILGCENCYKIFSNEINPIIKKFQGKTIHTGKVPKNLLSYYELIEEKNKIVKEFEKARKEQRMADADRLNKEISEITKHINSLNKKENDR